MRLMHRSTSWFAALALLMPVTAGTQTIQNATLRRAQSAFDNLDYRQALSLAQASLRERLSGFERGRAYELLGFTYSGIDSILKAVEAYPRSSDRKSTRLNSSRTVTSYAVFC